MALDDKKKWTFDWLISEENFANERMAAYSESDQKLNAAVATVIAASLALYLKKDIVSADNLPYALLIVSGLISILVIQSTIYSSLSLLFMQRKILINKNIAHLVEENKNIAGGKSSLFIYNANRTWILGMFGYYIFRSFASAIPILGSCLIHDAASSDVVFLIASGIGSVLSLSCIFLTFLHLYEFRKFRIDAIRE